MAVDLQTSVSVPLRDGISLSASIYRPAQQSDPLPVILMMTPYGVDIYHEAGMYFADRGFVLVLVDVRGRGNSVGEFQPRIQEADDGFDVVDWLAQQSFCNGNVVMKGGSYCGYAQWATASRRPPALKTIIPTASPYVGVDVPFRNNIFAPYTLRWLSLLGDRTSKFNLFNDKRFWSSLFLRWTRSGRALSQLTGPCEASTRLFREWLRYPEPGPYWDRYNPTSQQYADIKFPVLTITGAYDGDQPGALEHYRKHLASTPARVRNNHFLVIGPWDHAGTGAPATSFGGIEVGETSKIDLLGLHCEWYNWTLQAGPRPRFLADRVAYYVIGADEWKYARSLDTITARQERLFLGSNGGVNGPFNCGWLAADKSRGGPDSYLYDPGALQAPEWDAEAIGSENSLTDQSLTLALGDRQLIYQTAPLQNDVEVSGFFSLSCWISIDRPDTDIFVSIFEITSDGKSIKLSVDAIRARYREDIRNPALVDTQEPLHYNFTRFTFISKLIRRGHRIRLSIAPVGRLLDEPFIERNFNSGGVVADDDVNSAQPVTVHLHHDEDRPAILFVPIGKASPGRGNISDGLQRSFIWMRA